MDGKKLKEIFLDYLDEDDISDLYATELKIYECLDQAAIIFATETGLLHATVEITTGADTQSYDLPPGFIELYMKNRRGKLFVKYSDGTDYSFPLLVEHDRIYKQNLTDSKAWPDKFAVIDKESKESLIEGTADSAGAAAAGECTLHDASMDFSDTNKVYERDIIHNTTDGSDGIVLEVTDATHLKTALFGDGDNDWTLNDAYVIQPAAEKQIKLDAPSESAGHTIEVPYVSMPAPVFSDYGWWRFPPKACRGIVAGGVSIFKSKKREFKEAKEIRGFFAGEVRDAGRKIARQALYGN